MSGSNSDCKQNLYRVSSGTKPLLVFFPINTLPTTPAKSAANLTFPCPNIQERWCHSRCYHNQWQAARRLEDRGAAGGVLTMSRIFFFQGVLPPPFPLGTVARAWASKTFFVITNCFASIDSWFDFQQYDCGILSARCRWLYPILAFLVLCAVLVLLLVRVLLPRPLLLLCPFVLSTCRFYWNPPTSICLWIFNLQGQPHVRDKDAKVYADPPTPRIEDPVFVIQPIHLQPFGTPKKDLNLQVTILSFM